MRNNPEVSGLITSDDGLFEAISKALEVYQTKDVTVALRRIGKGVCPRSFPITPQSLYFLDLFMRTHGGDYGTEITNLPLSGGVLEQPNLFYVASDIISRVRSAYIKKRLDDGNERQNKDSAKQLPDSDRIGGGKAPSI